MTKRKCELQPLITPLPPCKKALCSRRCAPDTVHVSQGKKRKLEPESGPPIEASIPSPECERMLPPFPASTSPPSKKLKATKDLQSQDTHYKCQKDEAFPEYNSFQYWRIPLPDIDFSGLSDELCGITTRDISSATDALEEMDG